MPALKPMVAYKCLLGGMLCYLSKLSLCSLSVCAIGILLVKYHWRRMACWLLKLNLPCSLHPYWLTLVTSCYFLGICRTAPTPTRLMHPDEPCSSHTIPPAKVCRHCIYYAPIVSIFTSMALYTVTISLYTQETIIQNITLRSTREQKASALATQYLFRMTSRDVL